MVIDEAHIVTTNPLLSPYMTKVVNMWPKLGAWLWLATQNLADYPLTAEKMLNMVVMPDHAAGRGRTDIPFQKADQGTPIYSTKPMMP